MGNKHEINYKLKKIKKMKRTGQISGIVLVILMICSFNLSAQGGGRGAGNYSHMQGPGRDLGFRHNVDSQRHLDSLAFRGMRNGGRFEAGMGFGPQGRGGFNRMDGGQLPGLGRLENLAGITDKQKKEIIDLRYKQMAEIEKFRVDMQTKMQAMREEQRKKILELLTEDQKKLLEAGPQKPNANAPK
jgi:hypothetical protein